MNIRRRILTTLVVIAASTLFAAVAEANGTLIRWYKMGEQEGGTNNSPVSSTSDSPVGTINGIPDVQAIDLSATNSPTYRTIPTRPDGGTGIGIEFNAAAQQRLQGDSLNWPQKSTLDENHGGLYDLLGIDDRGFQLWVRPTSTADQSIVRDTTQHGVRIVGGRFSMSYAGTDYPDLTETVSPNTWYHIEVMHPAGKAGGSQMYVNGVAVAASSTLTDYSGSDATQALPLTIGSNLTGDGEFFSGIVDDMRMFVMGTSTSSTPDSYGTFNFAVDNAFAASPISGIKNVAGDVTNNGVFDVNDKNAFIAGWLHKHVVNGVQIGDMASRAQGDLNLDGITNIQDLLLMQNALTGAGIGSITSAELNGVPEPATALLAVLALLPVAIGRFRPRRA
jgi:hypothetical protein